MKSKKNIELMLMEEIRNHLKKISMVSVEEYYNDLMGDVSFLLAGLTQVILKQMDKSFPSGKWYDDCLLTKVAVQSSKISIWGVMISGIENSTDQWTEPFYFEVIYSNPYCEFEVYRLLVGDNGVKEIPYEVFNINRKFWDHQFYSNEYWNPIERNWKYNIIEKA